MNLIPPYKSFEWTGTELILIDQTKLPQTETYLSISTLDELISAIRRLSVRGAPLLGITAGWGTVLGMQNETFRNREEFFVKLESVTQRLAQSRPTAVNLFWALKRMKAAAETANTIEEAINNLNREAQFIASDDKERCEKIALAGLTLFKKPTNVITICNTGHLATGGVGTAFGVIAAAYRQGLIKRVFACETRPLLQGARLTTWELKKWNIPYSLITDNMVAHIIRSEGIDLAIAGADRIAANGDSANKIGTYGLAVMSAYHNVPFYIAAPLSTIDSSLPDGGQIPIEERKPEEVQGFQDCLWAPETETCNPAFDVTPSSLINGIITENGISRAPYEFV